MAIGFEGDYYELQDSIDFTHWLEYFADGILDELLRVRKTLPTAIQAPPRLEPHHKQILDYIEEYGSITQREYGGISNRSFAARKLDFEKLIDLDLIESKSKDYPEHIGLSGQSGVRYRKTRPTSRSLMSLCLLSYFINRV